MEKFEIETRLLKDGEVIAKRTTENWEVAEMNLQSLKDQHNKEDFKTPELVMSPKDVEGAY